MKLTKSKLKQLIREAYADIDRWPRPPYSTAVDEPGEERYNKRGPPDKPLPNEEPGTKGWWVAVMRQQIHDADALYKNMPPEGKQLLTQNFEMYADHWKKEQEGAPEEEYEEEVEI